MFTKLSKRLGFSSKRQVAGFLTVVTTGEIIYSGFEALKGTFYNLMLQVLQLSNAQLGAIFSLIGISVFFYLPGGWVNNRFSVRSLLIFGLLVRFFSMLVVLLLHPSFHGLEAIAVLWGITDAIFWPAVLHGIVLFTTKQNRALGFGLLESIRRTEEVTLNLLLVGVMAFISGVTVLRGGMFVYNLLTLVLAFLVFKFVPRDFVFKTKTEAHKSWDAFLGVLRVLKNPQLILISVAALAIYWNYITLIYTVPYLQAAFQLSTAQTAIFGIFNTGVMGIIAGLLAGVSAQYVFHSATKLMMVALGIATLSLLLVMAAPHGALALMVNLLALLLFSFTIFIAKSIMLAPIAELAIPERYEGAAMSVASFFSYAPIFWAYSLNGKILDAQRPASGYRTIFIIGMVVCIVGMICIGLQQFLARRQVVAR